MSFLYVGCIKFHTNRFAGNFCYPFNVELKPFYVYVLTHVYSINTTNCELVSMKVLQLTLQVNYFNELILRAVTLLELYPPPGLPINKQPSNALEVKLVVRSLTNWLQELKSCLALPHRINCSVLI
jgi:hypothetical protein